MDTLNAAVAVHRSGSRRECNVRSTTIMRVFSHFFIFFSLFFSNTNNFEQGVGLRRVIVNVNDMAERNKKTKNYRTAATSTARDEKKSTKTALEWRTRFSCNIGHGRSSGKAEESERNSRKKFQLPSKFLRFVTRNA